MFLRKGSPPWIVFGGRKLVGRVGCIRVVDNNNNNNNDEFLVHFGVQRYHRGTHVGVGAIPEVKEVDVREGDAEMQRVKFGQVAGLTVKCRVWPAPAGVSIAGVVDN